MREVGDGEGVEGEDIRWCMYMGRGGEWDERGKGDGGGVEGEDIRWCMYMGRGGSGMREVGRRRGS